MVDGKVIYEQTDTVPETSKSVLFDRSRAWIVNSFPCKEKNIISSSKDSGKIVSYGMTQFHFTVGHNNMPVSGVCYYKIQVECKENKARIRLYNITAKTGYGSSKPIEDYGQGWIGLDQANREQVESVKKAVNDLMVINVNTFKVALILKKDDF
jgi:Domain of unknown function (DUF4468) with TBP-like fold